MTVDDLNLTLASGAANAAAANGAGITVDGASATITYDGTNDEWDFNKDINVTGTATMDGLTVDGTAQVVATLNTSVNGSQLSFNDATAGTQPWKVGIKNDGTNDFLLYNLGSENVEIYTSDDLRQKIANNGDISFYDDTGSTAKFFWDASAERLGINTTSPTSALDVNGQGCFAKTYSYASTNYHIKLKSSYGSGISSYISNISSANRMDISAGGYYYGASLYQLTDGATGMGTINIGEDGTLIYQSITGATANSTVNPHERFRIDGSTGNVGIGTTSPGNKLEIQHGTIGTGNGSNNTLALRYNSTTLYGQHYMDANGLYHIRADGQGVAGGNLILGGDTSVQIWTGSTPESRVTVDSSGRVGIGCTPDAWSGYSVLQIGNGGALSANDDVTFLSANGYSSSTGWRYATTDEATLYQQQGGEHIWYGAASGSADAAISWSERMRIDSNGQVMIGHTSSFAHADADNLAIGDGTNNSGLTIYTGASKESSIIFGNAGTNGNIEAGIKYYHESHGTVANRRAMTFATGGSMAERMRIDSSGKVGINDTNPSQMLSVSGTGSTPPARFTATGNTNTLEVFANATASTSTGLLCNAGTNENDYSAKFRNYAGSTIMEVRGDSLVDTFGGIRLQDSNILAFGQSSDIRAYYDGTDSLYITAVNGTANKIKTNANETYIMQANGNQLITAIANSEVIINNDSSASIDFRVESDNEQYNFFCDASSEIIHFGEGTNSDVQSVIPAKTLAGRRHGYHGGNKLHAGQTFKYSESTGWTDAIKIDWHNVSWGAVCMRITGMYYYNASDNFSIVIGFQGYGQVGSSSYGSTSVSYDATSSGAMTWTNAIQLAQSATGETMIRQRAGDTTGDIIYRYEWQCYARSNQPILIIEQ
jgi:hypothetical protein